MKPAPKKQRKRMTLIERMIALILLFILLPCTVFSLVFYSKSVQNTLTEQISLNRTMLQTIAADVNTRLSQVRLICEELSLNEEITALVKTASREKSIMRIVSGTMTTLQHSEVHLSYLKADLLLTSINPSVPRSNSTLMPDYAYADDATYTAFLESKKTSAWMGPVDMVPNKKEANGAVEAPKIVFMQNIYFPGLKRIGSVRCGVGMDALFSQLEQWNIVDGIVGAFLDGSCVFHRGEEALAENLETASSDGREIMEGVFLAGNHLLMMMDVGDSAFCLRALIPYEHLIVQARQSNFGVLAVCILFAGLLLLVCCAMLVPLFRRMDDTMRQIRALPVGEQAARLAHCKLDEVDQMIDSVNGLLDQTDDYIRRLREQEADYRRAQALAFQYQVNPHFLFNSLYWLQMELEKRSNDDLSDSVALLGSVLHYNLSDSAMAMLSEERELMNAYTDFSAQIKNMDLRLITEWDERLDRVLVPRFSFQPLLENAIRHGRVDGKPLTLRVRVTEMPEEKKLRIETSNDGTPIEPSKLAALRERMNTPLTEDDEVTGIGLGSLIKRLRLLYGEEAQMTVSSETGSTSFVILLPMGGMDSCDF